MENIPLGGSTIPEFAERWGMGVSTVWEKIQKGKIRTVKLGPRTTRIPRDEEIRLSKEGAV